MIGVLTFMLSVALILGNTQSETLGAETLGTETLGTETLGTETLGTEPLEAETLAFETLASETLEAVTQETETLEPESTISPMDGKIVGGEFARIEEYPYQLSLEFKGRLACGATLIGDKWVLTAAHCTDHTRPQDLSVRVGSRSYERGGQVVKVKQIHQHKDYSPTMIDYDISLLELEHPVQHKNAIPIPLASADTVIKEGDSGVVTGWGLTNEAGGLSRYLRVVKLPVISQATCRSAYSILSISDRMFCAGLKTGGKDACQGDSGGPFVMNGKLTGVVSWGIGCARPNYPGVYTSIPALRDYIKAVTGI